MLKLIDEGMFDDDTVVCTPRGEVPITFPFRHSHFPPPRYQNVGQDKSYGGSYGYRSSTSQQ